MFLVLLLHQFGVGCCCFTMLGSFDRYREGDGWDSDVEFDLQIPLGEEGEKLWKERVRYCGGTGKVQIQRNQSGPWIVPVAWDTTILEQNVTMKSFKVTRKCLGVMQCPNCGWSKLSGPTSGANVNARCLGTCREHRFSSRLVPVDCDVLIHFEETSRGHYMLQCSGRHHHGRPAEVATRGSSVKRLPQEIYPKAQYPVTNSNGVDHSESSSQQINSGESGDHSQNTSESSQPKPRVTFRDLDSRSDIAEGALTKTKFKSDPSAQKLKFDLRWPLTVAKTKEWNEKVLQCQGPLEVRLVRDEDEKGPWKIPIQWATTTVRRQESPFEIEFQCLGVLKCRMCGYLATPHGLGGERHCHGKCVVGTKLTRKSCNVRMTLTDLSGGDYRFYCSGPHKHDVPPSSKKSSRRSGSRSSNADSAPNSGNLQPTPQESEDPGAKSADRMEEEVERVVEKEVEMEEEPTGVDVEKLPPEVSSNEGARESPLNDEESSISEKSSTPEKRAEHASELPNTSKPASEIMSEEVVEHGHIKETPIFVPIEEGKIVATQLVNHLDRQTFASASTTALPMMEQTCVPSIVAGQAPEIINSALSSARPPTSSVEMNALPEVSSLGASAAVAQIVSADNASESEGSLIQSSGLLPSMDDDGDESSTSAMRICGNGILEFDLGRKFNEIDRSKWYEHVHFGNHKNHTYIRADFDCKQPWTLPVGWAVRNLARKLAPEKFRHSRRCLGVLKCDSCGHIARPRPSKFDKGIRLANMDIDCDGACRLEGRTSKLQLVECSTKILLEEIGSGLFRLSSSCRHMHPQPPDITPALCKELNDEAAVSRVFFEILGFDPAVLQQPKSEQVMSRISNPAKEKGGSGGTRSGPGRPPKVRGTPSTASAGSSAAKEQLVVVPLKKRRLMSDPVLTFSVVVDLTAYQPDKASDRQQLRDNIFFCEGPSRVKLIRSSQCTGSWMVPYVWTTEITHMRTDPNFEESRRCLGVLQCPRCNKIVVPQLASTLLGSSGTHDPFPPGVICASSTCEGKYVRLEHRMCDMRITLTELGGGEYELICSGPHRHGPFEVNARYMHSLESILLDNSSSPLRFVYPVAMEFPVSSLSPLLQKQPQTQTQLIIQNQQQKEQQQKEQKEQQQKEQKEQEQQRRKQQELQFQQQPRTSFDTQRISSHPKRFTEDPPYEGLIAIEMGPADIQTSPHMGPFPDLPYQQPIRSTVVTHSAKTSGAQAAAARPPSSPSGSFYIHNPYSSGSTLKLNSSSSSSSSPSTLSISSPSSSSK